MSQKNPRQALTIIEILISLVILALVTGSVFTAFSGSRSMLASAREIAMATSLAGSYLAAAESVPLSQLQAFAPVEDESAPAPFALATLGLNVPPKPFVRKVSLLRLDPAGKEGGPFFQLRVEVTWPGKDGRLPVTYSSSTILAGAAK